MSPAAPARHRASARDAGIRIALHRLLGAVDAELEQRRIDAGLEPARQSAIDIGRYSSLRSGVPGALQLAAAGARRLAAAEPAQIAATVRALSSFVDRHGRLGQRRRQGEDMIDEFGFDREWTETLLPFFTWVYRNWWRVRTFGVANVPAHGRALLVANHAGVVPYDGSMVRTALLLEHPQPRHARALVLNGLFAMPGASWLMRRTGNTLAHTADAIRLLENDELVLVFPEGAKGTGKPWSERYRLRRFGRGGYVEMALRTGSPIIPVSIVGSEEIHPMLAEIPGLARLLGLPYAPVTPTFPLLGPAGLIPLPSSWIIEFHEPIDVSDQPADAADDPAAVLALSDRVRDVIQAGVYRNLQRRRSAFALS